MEFPDHILNPPTQSHANRPDQPPKLSVALQSPDNLTTVKTTLGHLRNQTIAEDLEIVMVTPSIDDLDAVRDVLSAFQGYTLVTCPAEEGMSIMRGLGIRASTAPYIAIGEDHCAPHPTWAEKLLEAFDLPEGYAGVAVAVHNANPASMLSWANLTFGYLNFMAPLKRCEVPMIPGSNAVFRKAALDKFGDDLLSMFGREGGLQEKMVAQGDKFIQYPDAKVYHKNLARWSSTWALRYHVGANLAHAMITKKNMGMGMRAVRSLFTPIDGAFRMLKIVKRLTQRGYKLTPKILIGGAIASAMHALGMFVGLWNGGEGSEMELYWLEFHRDQHMLPGERGRNVVLDHCPELADEGSYQPVPL
ncbi:MAG: glycosyltransferase [Planctomycetota bacterium]